MSDLRETQDLLAERTDEVALLRETVAEREAAVEAVWKEVIALRSRLAETEALLREAESDPHARLTLSWGERTRAFLNPTAPDSTPEAPEV